MGAVPRQRAHEREALLARDRVAAGGEDRAHARSLALEVRGPERGVREQARVLEVEREERVVEGEGGVERAR